MAQLLGGLLVAAALASVFVLAPSAPASAAGTGTLTGSQFLPGDIIDDAQFFTGSAMSQAQIQTFLTSQQRGCRNSSCLSIAKVATSTKPADAYCPSTYTGSSSETVAAMIYKVQVSCRISAKVLLATLQKEEGLVTSTAPSTSALNTAMGFLCPDTAACSPSAAGIFNQVYGAARQFQIYRLNPSYFNFRANMTASILLNPNSACGRKTVFIQNAATAALYNYTPYVPNAAALANLGGVGDSCSSYGNRNFWVYYNSWFGSGTPPFGSFDTGAVSNGVATVGGWAIDPTAPLTPDTVSIETVVPSGAITRSTVTANGNRPDVGKVYPYAAKSDGTTPHGFSVSSAQTTKGQYAFCVTVQRAPGSTSTAAGVSLGCKYQWYDPGKAAPTITRVSGADRYATAAALSKATFPTAGVPVVYLASGSDFADAASAAPAAAVQGGPLLLTTASSVPQATLTELQRLKPKKIVVVGGTGAISDAAAQAASKATGAPVTRLGGADRYATSEAIAKTVFPNATTAFVATGADYPDALSAGSAAGVLKAPVLLSRGTLSTPDAALNSYLAASPKIASVHVIGGTGVVSSAVTTGIRPAVGTVKTVDRVAGADRYLTSNAITAEFFPTTAKAFLATGADFADALTGAAAAAHSGAPLMVTKSDCLPGYEGQRLVSAGTSSVTLLGGTGALSSVVGALGACT